eukprot:maker-scaffold_4-snap-gene-14.9-mRNA-1 protein AED:0.00 eAED:0.00 QI:65/1/1/1/0.5/0.33/3/262/130
MLFNLTVISSAKDIKENCFISVTSNDGRLISSLNDYTLNKFSLISVESFWDEEDLVCFEALCTDDTAQSKRKCLGPMENNINISPIVLNITDLPSSNMCLGPLPAALVSLLAILMIRFLSGSRAYGHGLI